MINLDRKFRSFIYLFFFISLILSYLLNENSSGGASLDKIITKPFIDSFSLGFLEGINYSIDVRQVHSPIFYYVLFLMDSFFANETAVILYIFISSLIPFIFYKILKKKFKKKNKNFLFLLSLIIFLSPYFRSSAIWITNDNLALFLLKKKQHNEDSRNTKYPFYYLYKCNQIIKEINDDKNFKDKLDGLSSEKLEKFKEKFEESLEDYSKLPEYERIENPHMYRYDEIKDHLKHMIKIKKNRKKFVKS